MKAKWSWLLALSLILGGAALIILSIRKNVTLLENGIPHRQQTFALTVGGFLWAENVSLTEQDWLSPAASAWLRDGETITLERAAAVQIEADGQVYTLLTPLRTPANLLALAGIPLFPGDELWAGSALVTPDETLPYTASYSLQVRRSLPFTLIDGETRHNLRSTASSLGQALWEADILLNNADRLAPPPETPLTSGLLARLQRARLVTIQGQGQPVTLQTAALTVGEALLEAGIPLQGLDYPSPAETAPVPADGVIRIVHVSESVITLQTPIPFETKYEPDPNAELDTRSVLQPGVEGIQAQRIRIRYEDGQEITRTVESEWVARQPVVHIEGYGTKIVQRSVETADGVITYWRALTFWATAYSPRYTGGNTTTASGKQLRKGLVGIDVNYIPYGTMMYVPGYGYAEAADTGRIIGRWIDLGYSDDDFEPWHQWVTVYFLWPPPAVIPWIIPPPSYY